MCGIAGFIADSPRPPGDTIREMTRALRHRGPDDEGVWMDDSSGVVLGHRRLSIVDLSQNGHQPMISGCGRYVIVLNGEIYNHDALRKALDADPEPGFHGWRGRSDTEVLLAAIARWGLRRSLHEAVGMFAFGLWDRRERTLFLARDRFGEKPLYYGCVGTDFVFGSELKALRAFPSARFEIDRQALVELLQFGYVHSPRSIYQGIHKLPPGNLLAVQVQPGARPKVGNPQRYWSIDAGSGDPASGDAANRTALAERIARAGDEQRVDWLEERIREAVRRQLVADVPLGAFLSGGVDSSLIVALMQAESAHTVRTFTIGFQEKQYDEAPFAKAVARHLRTEHTEWYISPAEAASVITQLPGIFDEPFADSSQVPTALVARMTRRHVTVSLSGDGGDELFGGYPRYSFAPALWQRLGRLPAWMRHSIRAAATAMSPEAWDRVLRWSTPARMRQSVNGHRVHRLATMVDAASFEDIYVRLLSQWLPESTLVVGAAAAALPDERGEGQGSLLRCMRRWDIERYLPDDILVKVDRAAMCVGLETRAPLLDHRVAEFAWALPDDALIRNGRGKWLLRKVLDRYVPSELIDRPKAGFGMPVAHWLRTDLREWAEELLDERALAEHGLLTVEPIRRAWREHLAGTHDHQSRLWNVLMFQAWFAAQRDTAPAPRPETIVVG